MFTQTRNVFQKAAVLAVDHASLSHSLVVGALSAEFFFPIIRRPVIVWGGGSTVGITTIQHKQGRKLRRVTSS